MQMDCPLENVFSSTRFLGVTAQFTSSLRQSMHMNGSKQQVARSSKWCRSRQTSKQAGGRASNRQLPSPWPTHRSHCPSVHRLLQSFSHSKHVHQHSSVQSTLFPRTLKTSSSISLRCKTATLYDHTCEATSGKVIQQAKQKNLCILGGSSHLSSWVLILLPPCLDAMLSPARRRHKK